MMVCWEATRHTSPRPVDSWGATTGQLLQRTADRLRAGGSRPVFPRWPSGVGVGGAVADATPAEPSAAHPLSARCHLPSSVTRNSYVLDDRLAYSTSVAR